MALDFGARAQDFLKRITPLSADLAAHGPTRTLALQKLHRICQAEVRTLKARYTLATVKLALSKYRERDPRRGPRSLGLASKKDALRPTLQLSRARFRRNPHAQCRQQRAHPPRPIQSHSARVQKLSSKPLSNCSPATATSKKAWALWPSPGAGLPRSSLAPPSASLEKNSPFPPSSSTANSKPAKLPAPVSSHTSFPSAATPRKSSRPSTLSDR